MSKLRLQSFTSGRLSALLVVLLLTACDGGIFGTGDETTIDASMSSSGPSSGNDVIDGPDTESQSPNTGAPEEMSTPGTQAFDNLQVGSNQSEPLLTLVNVSSRPVNATVVLPESTTADEITADDEIDTVFASAILNGTISNAVQLPLGSSELSVFRTEPPPSSFTLSPLNLGASSVTTLVVRDEDATDSSAGLDVIALRTQRTVTDPDVALVRIVLADAADSDDEPVAVSLVPAGTDPGSGEVTFTNLSAQSAMASEYQPINAGTYALTDTLERIANISLNVQSGEIYTLIITFAQSPKLIIQQDSLSASQ